MSPDDPIWKRLFPAKPPQAPDPLAEALAAGSLPDYLRSLPKRDISTPKQLPQFNLKGTLDAAADFALPRIDYRDPASIEGGLMGVGMQPLTFVRYAGKPQFKSRLKTAVEAMPYGETKPKDAQGWLAQLQKGGDFSKDEFERVLKDPLLQSALEGKSLTKAEVLALGEARPVQIKESVRGAPNPALAGGNRLERAQQLAERSGEDWAGLGPNGRDRFLALADQQVSGPPRYGKYTTPGGENYREVVIQLDQLPGELPIASRQHYGSSHGSQYKSSHWEEPNPLVHVRMQDRTGPNGERILHVEEIQSDWHQAGRERGYRDGSLAAKQEQYKRAVAEAERTGNYDEAQRLRNEITDSPKFGGVPDAPFKDTKEWTGLALRRILDEAAEGGYDRVIWSPGAVQNQRYSLSQAADALEWDGGYINPEGGGEIGTLTARKGGEVVMSKDLTPDELPGVVGKEIAERLRREGTLTGPGLEVGGSGMKGYYDKILPETVRSYAKKLGVDIEIADDFVPNYMKMGGSELDALGPRGVMTQFPGFQMTPALKTALQRGQKLP